MGERGFLHSIALIIRGVLRLIDERLARCGRPNVERPMRVMVAGTGLRSVNNLKEIENMTQTIEGATIRGDAVGYVSEGAVVVLNEKGNPMSPQPEAHTLAVSHVGLADAYLTVDRRLVLVGDDAMEAGAPWEVRISAVETGEEDDFVWSGTYDPDKAGAVDGGALGQLFQQTGDLPPPATPPAPPLDAA